MRPFTGKGDSGYSSTFLEQQIPKNALIFELLGQLDSLNAQIGFTRALLHEDGKADIAVDTILYQVQNDLFEIGACLNLKTTDFNVASSLKKVEEATQQVHEPLAELKNFILPGGTSIAASLHICRTKARDTERTFAHFLFSEQNEKDKFNTQISAYLNRLSSLFFVLARFANFSRSKADVIWKPSSSKA